VATNQLPRSKGAQDSDGADNSIERMSISYFIVRASAIANKRAQSDFDTRHSSNRNGSIRDGTGSNKQHQCSIMVGMVPYTLPLLERSNSLPSPLFFEFSSSSNNIAALCLRPSPLRSNAQQLLGNFHSAHQHSRQCYCRRNFTQKEKH